jgi:YggT family protein
MRRLPRGCNAIGFAAMLPGDFVAGQVVASGISSFLSLYQAALTIRILLTWFPSPPQVIAEPLSTVCDPYLNLFRGIIPPIGGTIDLSPILAFVVLNIFTGSAASLGAELPPTEQLGRGRGKRGARTGPQETL